MPRSEKGFTLVELSIVLVIIGLLIGGILVAQSMMNTARDQRFLKDLQQYEIAGNNFKLNYKFYPGDDPYFTPPGNANGLIGGSGCRGVYEDEALQVFPHLSQGGMLNGNYQPYNPIYCGGAQTALVGGINGPYTELDANAVKASAQPSKSPITGDLSSNVGAFGFQFWITAQMAVFLEAKIGPSTGNYTTALGLVNNSGTSGRCYGIVNAKDPCTNPDAAVGNYSFFPNPI